MKEKGQMVEDVIIIGGLIGMQFIFAGNSVLSSYLMSLGVPPLSIVIFSTFTCFLFVLPFAFLFERKQWPKNLSLKISIQLLLISSCGVTLFQCLFLKGIEMTSPAMATAMPNLVPGLVFLIAWLFRFEEVNLRCIYSQVKIIGTVICVVGALTMSILHGTKNKDSDSSTESLFDMQKIIGGLCLMAAVFLISSNVVLQADTLREFPCPMTLAAVTSLIGSLITMIVELAQDHHITTNWPHVSLCQLLGYSFLVGIIGATSNSFNGWALKKRGPVLASIFNPLATVISIILSITTLNDTIDFGSVAGMCIIFMGLYSVLWSKYKERSMVAAEEQIVQILNETKRPLVP